MKQCPKCQKEKEHTEFYTSKSHKNGLTKLCKMCSIEYNKNYKKEKNYRTKINTKEYNSLWRKNNPEYGKLWYHQNKSKVNNYQKNKKRKNIEYKLSANIRTRISQTISGYSKSKSTLDILGVKNFTEFKQYLENQFTEGMNWENYGNGYNKWVIDHRIPIASAKDEQDILKLNHHSNLQPLWWDINLAKGAKLL
jgi:hypothetical protein